MFHKAIGVILILSMEHMLFPSSSIKILQVATMWSSYILKERMYVSNA